MIYHRKVSLLLVFVLVLHLLAGCGVTELPDDTPSASVPSEDENATTLPSSTQQTEPAAPIVPEEPDVSEPVPDITEPEITEPGAGDPAPDVTEPKATDPSDPVPGETDPVPTECDHSYETTLVAPSCTQQGYTTYTCSLCGEVHDADYTDPTGHKYGSWKVIQAANCTVSGSKTRTCKGCGKAETKTISATGHQYEGKITTPATSCQGMGTKTFTCKGCGHSYTTSFKGNHNFVYTSKDNTYYCSNCDFYYYDDYMQFEADRGELDRTSAMCCDTIKLKESTYNGPLSTWPEQWFEYSKFVKEGIVMRGWDIWSGSPWDSNEY